MLGRSRRVPKLLRVSDLYKSRIFHYRSNACPRFDFEFTDFVLTCSLGVW